MSEMQSNTKLIEVLKNWQKLEDAAVRNTSEIIQQTRNPLLQIVMEIIRQDSVMHRRVQQLILDSLHNDAFTFDASEIEQLWEKIEEHDEMERKVIKLAEESMKTTDSPIVNYLLDYLLTDEKKHDDLLNKLNNYRHKSNE